MTSSEIETFLVDYEKAADVLSSCKTIDQCVTAINYITLLQKKYPTEPAADRLYEFAQQTYNYLYGLSNNLYTDGGKDEGIRESRSEEHPLE